MVRTNFVPTADIHQSNNQFFPSENLVQSTEQGLCKMYKIASLFTQDSLQLSSSFLIIFLNYLKGKKFAKLVCAHLLQWLNQTLKGTGGMDLTYM